MKLVKLPEGAIGNYLGDRPRDPRVTYVTGLPRGKMYLTPGQKARRAEEAGNAQQAHAKLDALDAAVAAEAPLEDSLKALAARVEREAEQ